MVQPVPRFVLVFTELDKETQTNTAGKTSRLGTSIVSFALVLPELSTCRVVCTVYRMNIAQNLCTTVRTYCTNLVANIIAQCTPLVAMFTTLLSATSNKLNHMTAADVDMRHRSVPLAELIFDEATGGATRKLTNGGATGPCYLHAATPDIVKRSLETVMSVWRMEYLYPQNRMLLALLPDSL